MSRYSKTSSGFLIFWLLLVVVFFASFPLRTQPEKTKRILEQQNYTNVTTHGYAWFGCSEKDIFQTKFSATAPNGDKVTGCVCSGFFKKGTPRFDGIQSKLQKIIK